MKGMPISRPDGRNRTRHQHGEHEHSLLRCVSVARRPSRRVRYGRGGSTSAQGLIYEHERYRLYQEREMADNRRLRAEGWALLPEYWRGCTAGIGPSCLRGLQVHAARSTRTEMVTAVERIVTTFLGMLSNPSLSICFHDPSCWS